MFNKSNTKCFPFIFLMKFSFYVYLTLQTVQLCIMLVFCHVSTVLIVTDVYNKHLL